jgi:hypothetical protein
VSGKHVQEEDDKERFWGCANKSRGLGRVLWREDSSRGCRSTAREGAKLMPARCSTVVRFSEHARVRSVGTVQRAVVLENVQGGLGEVSAEVAQEIAQVLENDHAHGLLGHTSEKEGHG